MLTQQEENNTDIVTNGEVKSKGKKDTVKKERKSKSHKIVDNSENSNNKLPEIGDIDFFNSAGKDKCNNAKYNEIRENVIAYINILCAKYLNDPVKGPEWRAFKEKFINAVSPLCNLPYKDISIERFGGQKNNFDFYLSFIDENNKIVKEVKLEFKHNNCNVKELIQFLELYDKDVKEKFKLCEKSYAEFYYDNYLDEYLKSDNNLSSITKPSKEEYLRNVYDIKYKHPFFTKLYENKISEKEKKQEIANKSIKEYLELYSHTFNFVKITEKIRTSQSGKVFLMWDCENFHTQVLDIENINITGIKKIDDLYIDVHVANFEYNIRIRLNWGNNNGLANPRWKFTFIPL